jgi:hypothetical protein
MRKVTAIGVLLGLLAGSAVADEQAKAAQSPSGKTGDRQETKPLFMFVQTASSGTFSPIPDKPGHFRLTLQGVSPQTIFFSDRPERITGQAPTGRFLENLGFFKEDPPNAAVSLLEAGGKNDVVVVELLSPDYDAKQGTLSYEVAVLKDKGDKSKGLASFAEKADESLPPSFSTASLFIDDCPDAVYCVAGCQVAGVLPNAGTCWSWTALDCLPCSAGPDSAVCDQQFACNGNCMAMDPGTYQMLCHPTPPDKV